jgi:hypothetical protein
MKRVMIDIEGLSLAPNALILSIGAVFFDNEELGQQFYAGIDAYKQPNRHVSADTALWWIRQATHNPAAAAALFSDEHYTLNQALVSLAAFAAPRHPHELEFWFNGPQYDVVVLDNAYAAAGIKAPWKYDDVRDCRTVFKLAEAMGWDSSRVDTTAFTAHNAMADAYIQALRTISALKFLGID